MKKTDYARSFITLLSGLKKQHPHKELSVHLFGALEEYDGYFWGISDKELFQCLEKYASVLEIDELIDYDEEE